MNFVFYLHDESSIEKFEEKILWFKKKYHLISYQELVTYLNGEKSLHNACHITVDDGWRSTYEVIFPVMMKHKIPFTIFVSPEVCKTGKNFWYKDIENVDENEVKKMLIEKSYFQQGIESYPLDLILKELPVNKVYQLLEEYWSEEKTKERLGRCFINVDELREMHQSGMVEIGAHTLSHPVLSSVSVDQAVYEIKQSVSDLSLLLDKEITAFAYPNGLSYLDFGEREIQIVKQAGIKAAFSVDPGVLNSTVNPYAIPRVGSQKRLLLGRLGLMLPSLANQKGIRRKIRNLLIK